MKKIFVRTMIVVSILILGLIVFNEVSAKSVDKVYNENTLSGESKKTINEYMTIKKNFGEEIWPEFSTADIPVIVFNDEYEFLVGYSGEPKYWTIVDKDNIGGEKYYRKVSKDPKAYAVKVNDTWTGSMSNLSYLNRDMFMILREEMPFPLNKLIPYSLIKRGNDFLITTMIHESFHAFEAIKSPKKFQISEETMGLEDSYPYYDEKLNELFTKEGNLLSQALEVEDKVEKQKLIEEFLKVREERRKSLDSDLIEYEKVYEWLEGLAKYVEIKTYELAYENKDELTLKYKENPSYWKTEINNLKRLGEIDSELRFYVSGYGQAKLLEQLKLGTKWKDEIMEENIYLEDIFKEEPDIN